MLDLEILELKRQNVYVSTSKMYGRFLTYRSDGLANVRKRHKKNLAPVA